MGLSNLNRWVRGYTILNQDQRLYKFQNWPRFDCYTLCVIAKLGIHVGLIATQVGDRRFALELWSSLEIMIVVVRP